MLNRSGVLRSQATSHAVLVVATLTGTQQGTDKIRRPSLPGRMVGMQITTDLSVKAEERTMSGQSNGKIAVLIVSCSLLYLGGLVYYATMRPVDGDEGFYTTAARLVWEGKTPYKDFFFQQAPLLPYLYSWIWTLHPRSLVAMRMLSAFCGGLEVLLLGLGLVLCRRLPGKVTVAAFAAVLLNPYSVSWNVVVKTFAVANLFMTLATICLYKALRSSRPRWFFATGLALGLCVSSRSLYGPLIPTLLIATLCYEFRECPRPHIQSLSVLFGSLVGGLPMILSFLRDPRAFVFNNITYHHFDVGYMISGAGVITEGYQSVGHVVFVYFAMICVRLLLFHPFFTIQLILAFVGIISVRRLRRQADSFRGVPYSESDYRYFQIALLMLMAYSLTVLLPFPPYDQHFVSPLVPLLIPFVAEGLRVSFQAGRKRIIALAVAAPVLFAIEIGKETARHSWHPVWQLSTYREVTKVVENNTFADDTVMSFWPGFVFESGRQYFPGMEDHFVFRIINKTTLEDKIHYRVPTKDQILSAVKNRQAKLLIIHPWILEYYHDLSPSEREEFQAALQNNYSLINNSQRIEIYKAIPRQTQ